MPSHPSCFDTGMNALGRELSIPLNRTAGGGASPPALLHAVRAQYIVAYAASCLLRIPVIGCSTRRSPAESHRAIQPLIAAYYGTNDRNLLKTSCVPVRHSACRTLGPRSPLRSASRRGGLSAKSALRQAALSALDWNLRARAPVVRSRRSQNGFPIFPESIQSNVPMPCFRRENHARLFAVSEIDFPPQN